MSNRLARLRAEFPEVEVWAAGGVVHRRTGSGVEVVLVHRPHHRDWSLPKGKRDEGESLKQTALREVHEETGLRCRTVERLDVIRYTDGRGRPKGVAYWLMELDPEAEQCPFVANDEVDAMRWVRLDDAVAHCTYRHDADLLAGSAARAVGPG